MTLAAPLHKRKIAFVATTPFVVNAFLRTHILALSQKYDVTLFVNTDAYPLVDDVAAAVDVRHIPIARKIAPLQDLTALFRLYQGFRALGPDVVHSITPKAGLLAMMGSALARVRLRFHTFTGQVWATKSGLSRSLLKNIDRITAACATRVFADSSSQCRFIERETVARPGTVSVLGEGSMAGVDLGRFHPDKAARRELRASLNVADEETVFLFVGRIVRDKGVFDLIEAFASASDGHQNWQLWLVGPDEEGLETQLRQRAADSGSAVQWFGATMEPEAYFAASDLFVLPSYREGFGSVIIEAAACGLPTVAYGIDGVVDAIVDGQTGLLVSRGDIAELSQTMRALGEDPDRRISLGNQALARAQAEFSSEAVCHAWLDFYSANLDGA